MAQIIAKVDPFFGSSQGSGRAKYGAIQLHVRSLTVDRMK